MASRPNDRRGTGGDRDPYRGGNTHGSSSSTSKAPAPPLEEFWIAGEGIDRQVLQASICRFLGPEAISKPQVYEGQPGYRVRAYRQFTDEMIRDLKDRSREFRQENTTRISGGGNELPYTQSNTRRVVDEDMPDYDDQRAYAGPPSSGPRMPQNYAPGSSMGGNPASYAPPISTMGYAGPNYATTGSGYGPGPGQPFSPPPGIGQPGYNPGYPSPQYGQPDPRDSRAGGYQQPGGHYDNRGNYPNQGPGYGGDPGPMRPSPGYEYPRDAPGPRMLAPGSQPYGAPYDDNRYQQPGPSEGGRGRGYPPPRNMNDPYADQDMYHQRPQQPPFNYRPPPPGGGRR